MPLDQVHSRVRNPELFATPYRPVSVVEKYGICVGGKPVPILSLTPESSTSTPPTAKRLRQKWPKTSGEEDVPHVGEANKKSRQSATTTTTKAGGNRPRRLNLGKASLNSSRRIIEDIVELELCDTRQLAERHFRSLMPLYKRRALRKKMEKSMQSTVEMIAGRVRQIQQSLIDMLKKLELQENLDWPSLLESFAVLSSQFNSVLQILRFDRTPSLRNIVFLPVRLSVDPDPELQALTEGRLCFWNHAVAPDYLRTKPEPQVEIRDQQIFVQLQQRLSNPETVQKQINSFNRCLTNILENLHNAANEDAESEANRQMMTTYLPNDTQKLVAAISQGTGLKYSGTSSSSVGAVGAPSVDSMKYAGRSGAATPAPGSYARM